MIVRQPSASEDRPAIATSSIAGAIALSAGLWLAHAAMGHPAPQAIEVQEQEREQEHGREEETEETEDRQQSEPTATITAVELPPPSIVPPSVPSSPSSPPPHPSLAPPLTTAHAGTPAPIGTGAAAHVRHGRIAYLRCDGAPQTSGPFPCPRDAVLEATVASAIDQLIACTPPLPPGNADLVLEWDREVGPTVAITTRDTFPDDAVRTDGAAVVTCLTPALAALTTTIPGDRTRVGFRFELTN